MNTPVLKNNAPVVLIVSHDAGGAEILSSWVRRHPKNRYLYVLAGPAAKIFARKIRRVINSPIRALPNLIMRSSFVLTGISWASDLENKAILLAKQKKVRVFTFIDHWVNYRGRFQQLGKLILPDEIWVANAEAFKIAKKQLPNATLRLTDNPYLHDIKDELKKIRERIGKRRRHVLRILYLSEPISAHSRRQYGHSLHWGFTEFDALKGFLEKILVNRVPGKIGQIRVRLHPSEKKDKYKALLRRYPDLPISLSDRTTLLEDCLWCDWVMGCESMAMVVGLLARRKVFSVIPKDVPCGLPHKQITRFK